MSSEVWFRVGATALLAFALSTTLAVAQGHGNGHEKHDRDDGDDRDEGHDHGHGHDHDRGHGRYPDHDSDIHDWYRSHCSNTPPGLTKHESLHPGYLSNSWFPEPSLPAFVRRCSPAHTSWR